MNGFAAIRHFQSQKLSSFIAVNPDSVNILNQFGQTHGNLVVNPSFGLLSGVGGFCFT